MWPWDTTLVYTARSPALPSTGTAQSSNPKRKLPYRACVISLASLVWPGFWPYKNVGSKLYFFAVACRSVFFFAIAAFCVVIAAFCVVIAGSFLGLGRRAIVA